MTRIFEDKPAVRERTPLLIAIVSPSGAGKTYSALRLATGIQRIVGGDIGFGDTEARRALQYADKFKFRHLDFRAPFSPPDYLDMINHFVSRGVRTVIVDSASHEHEGTGGVLEMHEAELDRLAGSDWKKRKACSMLAWSKPKQQRRALINAILQMPVNFIFCFRAKEKIKPVKGDEPIDLGFQAISGDEWIYEMTIKLMLMPGSDGVPTWISDKPGEKLAMKIPEQFRSFFDRKNPQQLSEDLGEKLARWAAGDSAPAPATGSQKNDNQLGDRVEALLASYAACTTLERRAELEKERGDLWKLVNPETKQRLKAASDSAPIGKTA